MCTSHSSCSHHHGATSCSHHHAESEHAAHAGRRMWILFVASLFLSIIAWWIMHRNLVPTAYERWVWILPYIIASWNVFGGALREFREGTIFNEFTLMIIATVGAMILGDCPEAVAVMLFYLLGENLQEMAVERARADISSLAALRPEVCKVVQADGTGQKELSPAEVRVGQYIRVERGGRLPLDATLCDPIVKVDTAALTGETAPRIFRRGELLSAGMILLDRSATFVVVSPYGEDALSRIARLVEQAAQQKAPTERTMARVARIYTPAVVGAALLLAGIPALLAWIFPEWGIVPKVWCYRALVFLVASCPCALVLSIPLSFFRGIGLASRRGILFKGAQHLDAVARLDTVVFDKTGTLTEGVVTVQDGADSGEEGAFSVTDDRLRASSADAVRKLRAIGLHTVLLSGDYEERVAPMAAKLGIDEWHSRLLPADKLSHLERLLEEGRRPAFVGDGVNDAPVLARATVGFAMGKTGTDAAVEAADVVLATDEPERVIEAICIGQETRALVRQNIALAVGIKLLVLILSAFGLVGMWAAVFADTGVVLLCVLNVLRRR